MCFILNKFVNVIVSWGFVLDFVKVYVLEFLFMVFFVGFFIFWYVLVVVDEIVGIL